MERIYLGNYKVYDKILNIYLFLNSTKDLSLVLKKKLLIINANKNKYKNKEELVKNFIFHFLRRIKLRKVTRKYFEKEILFGKVLEKQISNNKKIKSLLEVAKYYAENYHKKYFNGIFKEKIIVKIKNYRNYLNIANLRGKIIFLNSKCYILPKRIIRYIIFHEMLHSLSKDHDLFFRSIENTIFPDNDNLKDEILKFMFIASLNDRI